MIWVRRSDGIIVFLSLMKGFWSSGSLWYHEHMKQLTLFLTLLAVPAAADVTYPSGRTVECYCTDRTGSRIELGETICLEVGGRMFMAQCQMSLNVPMWREVQKGCLSSSIEGVDQPLQSFGVHPQI